MTRDATIDALWEASAHGTERKDIAAAYAAGAAAERETCANLAGDYGPGRPVLAKKPSQLVVGRWEGEQAASLGIAAAIRARGQA